MHPLPLVGNALLLDNSSMEKQTTCPRSAQYYICDRRESTDERTALTFGGIIHKALECRYQDLSKPPSEVLSAMLASNAVEFEKWQAPEDDYRNYSMACQVCEEYLQHYPIEEFTVLRKPDGSPAVEVPFAVPLGELSIGGELLVFRPGEAPHLEHFDKLPVVWTGRIDVLYESQGRVYIMDHKTTSMMGPSYFKEFELSSQVYGYVWAASKLLNRSDYGFCVNALAIRKATKTGKGNEYIRNIVSLDQSLLEEWLVDTLHIVSDFVEMARREYFPKHTKWCVGKYGVCPYMTICSLPTAQREVMLMSSLFKTVEWSPLNQRT